MSSAVVPAVSGCDELPALRDAMAAAKRMDPGGFDAASVAALEDLLEPLDPASTGWSMEVAEAAVLLFGKTGADPTERAVRWLRYAQRAASVLASPLSRQSCEASAHLGERCEQMGRLREAAAAWEVVALGAEQRHRWQEANDVRLRWAGCLHRIGYCDDAVLVLRQAWDWRRAGRPRGPLTVATSCVDFLKLCGRRDEATAMLSTMDSVSTSGEKRQALDFFLTYADDGRAGFHSRVCAYHRPRESSLPRVPQQRRVVPPLGVGGCGHG
jgi:hypothetical protein